MSFFQNTSISWKHTAERVWGRGVEELGNAMGAATGLSNFGKNFGSENFGKNLGENFGRDFGKNIPTEFTVDIPPVVVQFPDLVTAASMLSESLANFDAFGGLARELTSRQAESMKLRSGIAELVSVLKDPAQLQSDRYYMELSFMPRGIKPIRRGSEYAYPPRKRNQECTYSLKLNGKHLTEDRKVILKATELESRIPPIQTYTVLLPVKEGINEIIFDKWRSSDLGDERTGHDVFTRGRVLRKTLHWTHTVAEFSTILWEDGDQPELVVKFPYRDEQFTAKKLKTDSSSNANTVVDGLVKELDLLDKSLAISNIKTNEKPTSLIGLLHGSLIGAYSESLGHVNKVEQLLRKANAKIAENYRNVIDIRSPVFLKVRTVDGQPIVKQIQIKTHGKTIDQHGNKNPLTRRDEFTVPVLINYKAIRECKSSCQNNVEILADIAQNGHKCAVEFTLYSGNEWELTEIGCRTISLDDQKKQPKTGNALNVFTISVGDTTKEADSKNDSEESVSDSEK